jgi:aryl-alcohol dehydrogenase-like predicted oxidoreductase
VRYTTFGRRTGLQISRIALGTGNLGTRWGHGTEPDEARRILDRFVEAGGTVIDTANVYQSGQSEELVGDFVRSARDDVVLASKFGFGPDPARPSSVAGNGLASMRSAVEGSLRRLGTDRLDVLWVHCPDALTPIDEVLRGLSGLVDAGKVLHIGFSNFPAWRVARASLLADVRGWAPVAGIQTEYSLVERGADRELVPMAEALGLGVAMWSPLGGGLLTGKYRHDAFGRASELGMLVHAESSARTTAVLDAVIRLAGDLDATPAQVATAWLLERCRRLVTPAFPVVGPRSLAHLDDYLAALTLTMTPVQFDELDRLSAPELGSPHDGNLASLDAVQGGRRDRLDVPVVPVA